MDKKVAKYISLTELTRNTAGHIADLDREPRTIVTRHGKPVAMISPHGDLAEQPHRELWPKLLVVLGDPRFEALFESLKEPDQAQKAISPGGHSLTD